MRLNQWPLLNIIRHNSELRLYHNGYGVGKSLQFVHQLQNLYFALTGEELTIRA